MRRNFNLNLCLLPPSQDSGDHNLEEGSNTSTSSPQQQQQQLTIFYNGRICVCDVTVVQARAIIWMATQEADERMGSPNSLLLGSTSNLPSQIHSPSTPTTTTTTTTTTSTGVSMKMSLQRFLQKRNNRIYATHPYQK